VRPVDHAACDSRLLLVVCLLLMGLGRLGHMLEVHKAAECVSVCLCLHHLQGLLVVMSFTMDRTGPDHHLCLVELGLLEVLHVQALLLDHRVEVLGSKLVLW